MPVPENLESFATLVGVIAQLRSPAGCPWDRKQTHASLRENLLSECYEALAALDEGDAEALCEELGDLLLQVVLHAQIARDDGEFAIGDVIRGITAKIVRRHPHIFGTGTAQDAEEVAHRWESLKEEERESGASMLAGVPPEMPALGYSLEVQKRVARVGFDWADTGGVIEKLVEEVGELREAGSDAEREQEFGDLLFTLVNVGRRMGIDAETALRQANRRFYRRFVHMEEVCRQRGVRFAGLSFEEQNALWENAKQAQG
ncbi:MAG: nucleoside triphosphate pyrophosphohydrolase [Chloroflexota bacterium]